MGVWMEKVFLQILNMSLIGSYCVLAVLLVRLLLKRQPKIFSYALWLIVLFRLVCPVSFESPFSVFRMTSQQVATSQGVQSIYRVEEMGIWMGADIGTNVGNTENVKNSAGMKNSVGTEHRETTKNNQLAGEKAGGTNFLWDEANGKNLWSVAKVIWLVGVSGMLIYAAVSAILLKKGLKSAEKREGYYVLEQLETPFVFGIVRPGIYLPANLSEKERCYILEHERTHIRRRDYLIKPLAFLVLCIHWFNPFVWLAFFCMTKDMEMSCDEAVLKKLGKEIKQDYSTSLLNLACGRRFLNGSPLAFGEGEVKGRIKNILNYKKPGFWGVLLAVFVIAATGIVLISNPKSSQKDAGKTGKDQSAEVEKHDGQTGSDTKETSKEKPDSEEENDSLPVYQSQEEEQLKELLASYGSLDFEELHLSSQSQIYCNDIVIIDTSGLTNLERWNEFRNQAETGGEDAVLILQYTTEGDAVLRYVSYRDGSYYQMCDNTRDKWGSQEYESAQTPFLKEYFDRGYVEYYLTDENDITIKEIEEHMLSSQVSEQKVSWIFSFPYAELEESMGTEAVKEMEAKDLEACITKAVLAENESMSDEVAFQTESHLEMKIEEKDGHTTIYAYVLHAGYNSSGRIESASYVPAVIIFAENDDGTYELEEYWTPKDGSYYKSSIEEKFPEELWEDALDGQEYIDFLQEQCDERAANFFSHQEQ